MAWPTGLLLQSCSLSFPCLDHLSLHSEGMQPKGRTHRLPGKTSEDLFHTTSTVGGWKVWEDVDEKDLWGSIEFPVARTIKNKKREAPLQAGLHQSGTRSQASTSHQTPHGSVLIPGVHHQTWENSHVWLGKRGADLTGIAEMWLCRINQRATNYTGNLGLAFRVEEGGKMKELKPDTF